MYVTVIICIYEIVLPLLPTKCGTCAILNKILKILKSKRCGSVGRQFNSTQLKICSVGTHGIHILSLFTCDVNLADS